MKLVKTNEFSFLYEIFQSKFHKQEFMILYRITEYRYISFVMKGCSNMEAVNSHAKIPSNYFMKWLKERMSESFGLYENDSPSSEKDKLQYIAVHGSNGSPIKYACLNPQIKIELFYDERKYIADFIDERTITQKWNPKIPVFISAQTGSGKSTFIRDVLLRYLKEHFGKNAKILFLYNRLALGRQNKLIAANQAPLYGSTASLNDIKKIGLSLFSVGRPLEAHPKIL